MGCLLVGVYRKDPGRRELYGTGTAPGAQISLLRWY